MIPRHIYFTFGLTPDFDNKPFSLVHYLAIRSAKEVNPDYDITLHYYHEPSGIWWESVKGFCQLVKYKPLETIFGNPLEHPAYKADIFRLQMMNQNGGIYLDIDTICINSFDGLLNNEFVMAKEVVNGKILGLCNAVLMAIPNSKFGTLWMEEYRKNYAAPWGDMQVRRPYQVFLDNPSTITVLPSDAFFKYDWTPAGLVKVHEEVNPMTGAYALHLWEQMSFNKYLRGLTPEYIRNIDTTYTLLARPFV